MILQRRIQLLALLMSVTCFILLEGVHCQEETDDTIILQVNPTKIGLYDMNELEDFLGKLNDQQFLAQEKL